MVYYTVFALRDLGGIICRHSERKRADSLDRSDEHSFRASRQNTLSLASYASPSIQAEPRRARAAFSVFCRAIGDAPSARRHHKRPLALRSSSLLSVFALDRSEIARRAAFCAASRSDFVDQPNPQPSFSRDHSLHIHSSLIEPSLIILHLGRLLHQILAGLLHDLFAGRSLPRIPSLLSLHSHSANSTERRGCSTRSSPEGSKRCACWPSSWRSMWSS